MRLAYKPIAVLLMGFAIFLFRGNDRLSEWPVGLIKTPAAKIFAALDYIGGFAGGVKRFSDLVSENQTLKRQNLELEARTGFAASLEKEVLFLRESMNLPVRLRNNWIDAGVFGALFTPEGHSFLINKGSEDSIRIGDTVISSSGALIGRIDGVFLKYSRAIAVTDPDFKVTVNIGQPALPGIGTGDLDRGVFINLISQADAVEEGELVLTSGNDLVPAGILIGRISAVEDRSSDVFRRVYARPAFKEADLSKVLIIGQ